MKPKPRPHHPQPGIRCPQCGGPSIKTIDSRPKDDMKRRRRECAKGHRFTTMEQVEAHVLHRSRESWFGKLLRCLPDDRETRALSISIPKKELVFISFLRHHDGKPMCSEMVLTKEFVNCAKDEHLRADIKTFWEAIPR